MARRTRPAARDRAGSQPPHAATPRRRPWLAVAVFLAAVFAIKLVAVLQLKDHILLQPDAGLDTTIYVTMAQRVLNGDLSLGPGLYFISPLYIYFLAAVLALAKSFTAVRIVQIVLGTAGVALIFATARIWFGTRAAWIAATLAALTGLFTFYEVLLLQAALDPVLTAAALACLAVALTRGSRRWFVLAGLTFGIQTLNRPNVLIAAAGIALVVALTRRGGDVSERAPGAFGWRGALALAAGLLIGLAPVTVRNLWVAGDWSPVSSHGGLNFYIGNNAQADGTYHGVPGITPTIEGQQHDARVIAEQKIGRPLSDAEVSAYFYGQGAEWIRAHPRDAARLFARKIAYTFNSAHLWLNFSLPFYANDMRTVLRWLVVGPWLLIPLGLFGLALPLLVPGTFPEKCQAPFRMGYLAWVAFLPFYALAVAIFFASERYRLPLLIPFAVGGGAAIDWLIRSAAARNVRAMGIAAAALAVLFVFANWRFGLDNGLAEERTRMAERLIMLDRFDEASAWAARAEPLYPRPAVMHFRLGRRLLLRKHPERALPLLRKAEELQPGQAEVAYALGQALLDTRLPMEAIPYLRRAYEAGVRSDLAGFDLARAYAATGNRPAALAVLQNVRPADPKDAASWHGLGQLALDLEAPRLAEAFFRRAIAAKPDAAASHGQLGLTLAFMARYDEAIREMQEAVRLDPRSPSARLNLAVALAEVGRMREARALATEAVSLDPKYERARQFLAAIAGK